MFFGHGIAKPHTHNLRFRLRVGNERVPVNSTDTVGTRADAVGACAHAVGAWEYPYDYHAITGYICQVKPDCVAFDF